MKPITPQYLAGFFDGEGCVSPRQESRTGLWHPSISIAQSRPYILELIQEELGFGNVRGRKTRDLYHLSIRGRENIEELVRMLDPYSIVKKEQLRLAYRMCQHVGPTGPMKDRRHATRRQELAEELRFLNHNRII